jgi:hypothetical protein
MWVPLRCCDKRVYEMETGVLGVCCSPVASVERRDHFTIVVLDHPLIIDEFYPSERSKADPTFA